MTDFLERVAAERRSDIQADAATGPDEFTLRAKAIAGRRRLASRLKPQAEHLQVIAEIKRISPAAGTLKSLVDSAEQARRYVAAGASAISVLVEPRHWGGALADLEAVRAAVDVPILAKDVVVDERQLLLARAAGADLVLLIAELLDDETLRRFVQTATHLGMEALVEAHEPLAFERAVASGARLVGVNARNLRAPTVIDPARIHQLESFALPGQLLVAESGIASADDARRLPSRVDAVLVGTALMRADDPGPLIGALAAIRRTVPRVITQTRPGRYGEFGGQYLPETLMPAVAELERAWLNARADPTFQDELARILRDWVGRPTPLTDAPNLARAVGLARVLLKREDLAHTGAHKINSAVGQALLAKQMGKRRIVAETGAGQHGVATAAACALLGLECVVYMGTVDARRQHANVFRMKLLGAEVREVDAGSRTLKDAVNEAIRDWVTNVRTTYYLLGSAIGPHPYPAMVRDFQSVIGREAKEQAQAILGRSPDVVVACVGGGSNAIGIFSAFIDDPAVKLVGVEAGGEGIGTGRHAASIVGGEVGVLHGSRTLVLQDAHGQIRETHSVSAGLDYPGVGPEHASLARSGRVRYVARTDREALDAFALLSRAEGIIPALEPAHAIAELPAIAREDGGQIVLVGLSGRGDKDLEIVMSEGTQR